VVTAKAIYVTTFDIRGASIKIYVAPEWGRFCASYEGRDYSGTDYETLRAQLMTATRKKKVKVAVPAHIFSSTYGRPSFDPVILTGINARTDHVEYKRDHPNATTQQDDRYSGSNRFFKALTTSQIEQGMKLFTAYKQAEEAWQKFRETYGANIRKMVTDAMEIPDEA
jgi:hypothetical protein